MKKSNIFYGALGFAALGLTACSSDAPVVPNGNGVAQDTEIRYMRIAISNPPSTRAAEFEEGTAEENNVGSLYLRFYDANGNPVTGEQITTDLEFKDNTGTPIPSVGKIKEAVVQITLQRGANYPAYVMAFINPVNFSEIGENVNLYDLRDQIRNDYKANNGDFAMNNAVYYGDDPISGASQVKLTGAPILATQLYTTEEEAKEATDAVEIYVERYAAKVNFTLDRTGIQPVNTQNGYTLTFKPVAWSINADADEMYATKRFEDSNSATETIPTFGSVQSMLGGWTTWNDAPNHRSYWACSPSFYADQFPQVSDDIIDQVTNGTGAGVLVGDYKLRYYSYNQIIGTSDNSDGYGITEFNNADGAQNWKYVLENTMGEAAFKSLNPKAAAPSLILVGEYEVANGSTAITAPNGFCLYGDRLYFKDVLPTGAPEGAQTILDALLNANQILATSATGSLMNANNAGEAIKNQFEIVHPSLAVRGTQKIPHRYVTLQLKSDASLNGLFYKPVGSDRWVALTPAEGQTKEDFINSVNLLLWQQIGNASAYTENKGYFSIPIQHLGIYENTNGSPIGADGSIDWTKVRVGDFGLVRNHVYSIEVDGITGRASGIEDLNNPLVPSMDETNYFVKYRINILNWRIVPTQDGIIL